MPLLRLRVAGSERGERAKACQRQNDADKDDTEAD
jgi:hypothetical protein